MIQNTLERHAQVAAPPSGRHEYLTSEELAARIKFDRRYIREQLKGRVFREGVHFVRPFGGRKILFLWDAIERLLLEPPSTPGPLTIPLRRGGRT
jgi:hypothetical protein